MSAPVAQARCERLLQEHVDAGLQRGVQLAIYRDGKLVVNTCAGTADADTGEAVGEDTLFPVFSVSKGVAATVVHRLVQRRILAYDSPIAAYWPEFDSHGKERITLRQARNHTAGLPNMPPGIGYAQLVDWDAMCAALAGCTPVSPAGERAEYHAMTYGWLVGETACRATGRRFPELLDLEVCAPLGLRHLYIGLPEETTFRLAVLEEPAAVQVPRDDSRPAPVPGWIGPLHAMMNRSDMQHACLPATSGLMTALDLARHYAALLPGGVDGVELLPPDRVREAITPQPVPAPPGDFSSWMLGYAQNDGAKPTGPPITAFGHGGYGGSTGFADLSRRLAVGFTKNLFQPDDGQARLFAEIAALFPV